MNLFSLLVASALLMTGVSVNAAPEIYLVEPMVCKGELNASIPGWADSYNRVGLKVTSFRSMRKNCTLADSTATVPEFFEKTEQIATAMTPEIGNWFNHALTKDGDKVLIPSGAWTNDVELKVTGSKEVDGKRIDTLVGREVVLNKDGKEYFYDYTCEAIVVEQAAHIENNTASCSNP